MKVADYIIKVLADEGIKEAFLVYGAANGDIVDAFTRNERIRYICTMHEQAAGFAAEGYAKISRKFGVAIATSGPGGQNFVTPIGNCFYDSVPVLFITGQVKTQFMRPNDSIRQVGFQETDIVKIVEPITKYAVCVKDPLSIRYELEKALFLMKNCRPGPVLLDIPIDVQQVQIDPESLAPYVPMVLKPGMIAPNQDEKIYANLLKDIKASKRPIILVGGGAFEAREAIRYLSTTLGVPVCRTWNARDIITDDFVNFGGDVGTYGGRGRNFAIQNCDLLISIGSRISGRITGGKPDTFARHAKKWMIDIDLGNLLPANQQFTINHSVMSDAKQFTIGFIQHVEKSFYGKFNSDKFLPWMYKCKAWVEAYDPVDIHADKKVVGVNPYLFMRSLSDVASEKDIIVSDCGGNQVIFAHAFKTKRGQRCFTNNGNSPMGFSMCGAMGAWFVQDKPEGNTICIIGDGGMTMNSQELQTIKNYDIDIKIFILDNRIYGITKAFQEVNFEGRAEACGPKGYAPPDFVKVAMAYGVRTVVINNPDTMDHLTALVLREPGPIVCIVKCPEWHSYYPKISGWHTPIEDMEPLLNNKEFMENMLIRPSDATIKARGL